MSAEIAFLVTDNKPEDGSIVIRSSGVSSIALSQSKNLILLALVTYENAVVTLKFRK